MCSCEKRKRSMSQMGRTETSARRCVRSVLYPRKQTWSARTLQIRFSAMCGRLRIGKDFLHAASWSVLPCVRPLSAVHMTAGHNALRGSGPGQNRAFDDAMAHVGCPDRRIDRLCITCCSPSQPSHHAGCPARSRLPGKCRGLFVTLALGHHGPGHPRDLVGERDRGDLGRATA